MQPLEDLITGREGCILNRLRNHKITGRFENTDDFPCFRVGDLQYKLYRNRRQKYSPRFLVLTPEYAIDPKSQKFCFLVLLLYKPHFDVKDLVHGHEDEVSAYDAFMNGQDETFAHHRRMARRYFGMREKIDPVSADGSERNGDMVDLEEMQSCVDETLQRQSGWQFSCFDEVSEEQAIDEMMDLAAELNASLPVTSVSSPNERAPFNHLERGGQIRVGESADYAKQDEMDGFLDRLDEALREQDATADPLSTKCAENLTAEQEKILNNVVKHIEDTWAEGSFTLITGPGGSGKSVWLSAFLDRFKKIMKDNDENLVGKEWYKVMAPTGISAFHLSKFSKRDNGVLDFI